MPEATGPEGHKVLAALHCGCMITTDGEDLHTWVCSPGHNRVLADACRAAAADMGIPYQEIEVD